MKKILLILIPLLCHLSCFLDIPIPHEKTIIVPFRHQEIDDLWCGVACVQMWALRDGRDHSQHYIASRICGSNGKATMEGITYGAQLFTNSVNAICAAYLPCAAGQDDALATGAGSLAADTPAIIPFYGGTHAVIANGFKWTETLLSHEVRVLSAWLKDPLYSDEIAGSIEDLPAYILKMHFTVINNDDNIYGGSYAIVVKDSYCQFLAETGYKNFLQKNGTYYGGPLSYIPDGSEFVRIKFPIGAEQLELGAQIPIEWESNGLSGNIKLELLKGDTYWGTIATDLPIQQGSYNWIVGQYQGGTVNTGDDYKIKITMMDGSDYDTSNVDFSITDPPSITVVSPNGGESWNVGSTHDITWTSTGAIEFVKIEYSSNDGTSWSTITEQTSNNGIFHWTIPNTPSTNCLVRVSRLSDPSATNDVSNAHFTIITPVETISIPSLNSSFTTNTLNTSISFSASGSTSSWGDSVQYKFDWGDGTSSNWLTSGTTAASHSWGTTGTYSVLVKARCVMHPAVESTWSVPRDVIIYNGSVSEKFNSPAHYKVLPEVIWAQATGGGTWISEVQVTDVSGGSKVSVVFNTASEQRGPFLIWDNSSGTPFSSMKYANLLQTIDGLDPGTFTYCGAVGAVEFITQDVNHKMHAAVRTAIGNYSKTFSALSLHDANTATTSRVMIVSNLSNNAIYRSTVGFFNPTADSITVEFTLLNNSGGQIGTQFNKTLAGHGFQTFDPFTQAGVPYPGSSYDSVILRVRPISGMGKVVCFGATVNNTSNDPAAHMAVQAATGYDNGPGSLQVLPEVIWASATGGGTWVSEAQLTDVSGGSQVSVYYNTLSGRRGPFLLWNNSGGALSSIKYTNLLQTIDGLDAGTFTYYGTVGSVEFVTQDNSHLLQAAVRELNGNYAKTFSGLNLVDAETANTTRAMLVQNLTNNASYRSTAGFFNPTSNAVTVEFTLLNGSGGQIGTQFSKTLAGHDFQAFNPFNQAGVPYPGISYDNAILRVRPTAGAGKVMCFGATANNTSNDPASHLAVQGQ